MKMPYLSQFNLMRSGVTNLIDREKPNLKEQRLKMTRGLRLTDKTCHSGLQKNPDIHVHHVAPLKG
jgi:hypothetical protein